MDRISTVTDRSALVGAEWDVAYRLGQSCSAPTSVLESGDLWFRHRWSRSPCFLRLLDRETCCELDCWVLWVYGACLRYARGKLNIWVLLFAALQGMMS
jgi:hypothetical protein